MSPCYKRNLSKGIRYWYKGELYGIRYHSKAIYATRTQCRQAEARKIREIEEHIRNPQETVYLLDLLNERLDLLKLKKSHDYYRENQRYFKKLLDEVGNIDVSKITKKMIHDLLMKEAERLKKAGKTNAKINSMIRAYKALFNYAINIYDLTIKNPVKGLQFYPVDIKLKYIPSDKEISAVREKLNPNQRLLFDFIDQTACRINEAIRFTYEDMDGDLITLYTRKSKNSNLTPRRIPKPECLSGMTGTGKVFKDWNIAPRFIEEALKTLDLPGWNHHNLRHRRASIWARDGMSTLEIMTRLGHSSLSTTMIYLQLLGFTRG